MPEEPATAGGPNDPGVDAPATEGSSGISSARSPRNLLAAARAKPRRATLFVALCGLAVVGLIAVGLAYRPNSVSVVIAEPSSVVLGSDGIPTQVDDQTVYRVGDESGWQNLGGSVLVGGYAIKVVLACPSVIQQPPAETDLLFQPCGGFELAPKPLAEGSYTNVGNVSLAPLGSDAVVGWLDGPPIVVRVHSHDPKAAQCAASDQAQCSAAVVVEAVVWPVVPTQIGGQRVYRHGDQASFAKLKGSFLLGGPLVRSEGESPCMWPRASEWAALIALTGACPYPSIDGLSVAAKSTIDEARDEIVVARVHVNDPEAAQCPSDYRAYCEAAIVVESVVWRAPPG